MSRKSKRLIYLFILIFVTFSFSGYCFTSNAQKSNVVINSTAKKGTKFKASGLKYKVTSFDGKKGTVAVAGIIKNKSKIIIPNYVSVNIKNNGSYKKYRFKVTAVAKNAFANSLVKEVTLCKNIQTIDKKAFYNCKELTTVKVKSGSKLKYIKSFAFGYDFHLTSVEFTKMKKLDTIDDNAFDACNFLYDQPYSKFKSIKKLAKKASKYKYYIEPIIAPLNKYFYVRTNNKNINGIRFCDSDYMKGDEGSQCAAIELDQTNYLDVKYEDKSKFRVKNGYIFKYNEDDNRLNGGKMVLQVLSKYGWVNTDVYVGVPEVINVKDYIYQYYAKGKDFESKLKSVHAELENKVITKFNLLDTNVLNDKKIKYPYMTVGNYGIEEFGDDLYKNINGLCFSQEVYPFTKRKCQDILMYVATKLAPSCTVKPSYFNTQIDYKNKTYVYSFSVDTGNIRQSSVHRKYVNKYFLFDGSSNDCADMYSIDVIKSRLETYLSDTKTDTDVEDRIITDNYNYNVIGSAAWLKLYNGKYVYVTHGTWYLKGECGYVLVKNAWVDGRYVNEYGVYEPGAKFSDHPNASIIVQNKKYMNYCGRAVVGDLTYTYNSSRDRWESYDFTYSDYVVGGGVCLFNYDPDKIPSEFIFNNADVKKMKLDKNTNKAPLKGYIFDGTKAPGTKFAN